ncbi:MAG: pentapeptide repeat-containing protein [Bacteroidota bacterium]
MEIYCETGHSYETGTSTLSGIILDDLNLHRAVLESQDLSQSSLESTNLRGAFMYEANLNDCNFKSANLITADLRKATLCNANLTESILYKALLILQQWASLENGRLIIAILDENSLYSVMRYGEDVFKDYLDSI